MKIDGKAGRLSACPPVRLSAYQYLATLSDKNESLSESVEQRVILARHSDSSLQVDGSMSRVVVFVPRRPLACCPSIGQRVAHPVRMCPRHR